MSNKETSPLDSELAAILEREKKLKLILAAQIRVKKLETKLMLTPTPIAKKLRIIADLVSLDTGIPWHDIRSKTKISQIADARQMVCYFSRLFEIQLADIGRQLNLDHGTVIWAVKKISNWILTDERFKARMLALRQKIDIAFAKEGILA